MSSPKSPLTGIALKIASVCALMAMSSLVKAAADTVPPGQIVFFRSLFALPIILAWLAWRRELASGLKTRRPLIHLTRGLVGTTAMGLMFTALGLLPLPEVTAIFYAAPILLVVFAALFLGEQVRLFRSSMVALGMIGVLIVLSPRLRLDGGLTGDAETLGAVAALGCAVLAALAMVFVRKMVATETTAAIVFYFSITATLLSLMTLPWGWVRPDTVTLALLVGAGLLGGVGQILLTSSFRYADASLIAPFEYTSMLLAIGVGYAVFGEVPTAPVLAGATLITLAGLMIIRRERQLGLERARQRKAAGNQP